MKYPDINIQMKYTNKLINADTPYEQKSENIYIKSLYMLTLSV